MTSEGLRPRVNGVFDATKCHDEARGRALQGMQLSPAGNYEVRLTTPALLLLLKLTCASSERLAVNHPNRSLWAEFGREAGRALELRQWAELRSGDKWLELTDAGRDAARALLAVAEHLPTAGGTAQAGKPAPQGREEGARV